MELAQDDQSKRTAELVADEAKEKKTVKSITRAEAALGKSPEEAAAAVAKAEEADAIEEQPKRKPPTLYRPGEVHENP
jgi:hypothetical protein